MRMTTKQVFSVCSSTAAFVAFVLLVTALRASNADPGGDGVEEPESPQALNHKLRREVGWDDALEADRAGTTDASTGTTPPPSSPPHPPRDYLENPMAYFVLGAIWLLMVSAILGVCMISNIFAKEPLIVADEHNPVNATRPFVVKVKFGKLYGVPVDKKFNLGFELLRERKKYYIRLKVTKNWLINRSKPMSTESAPDQRVVKFKVLKTDRIPEICFARLDHDCYGAELMVYGLEVKDISDGRTFRIPVHENIEYQGPDKGFDSFTFKAERSQEQVKPGDDIFEEGVTPNISPTEYVIFIFLCLNIVILTCPIIPIEALKTLQDSLINGATASVVAAVITIAVILLYKYIIKRNYALSGGQGAWKVIRLFFLILVFVGALIAGGVGAAMAGMMSDNSPPAADSDNEEVRSESTLWLVAVGLGVSFLFFLIIPLCLLCICICSCFQGQAPEEVEFEEKPEKESPKSRRRRSEPEDEEDSRPKKKARTPSEESTGAAYYKNIMASNPKVKSISQYVAPGAKPAKRPEPAQSRPTKQGGIKKVDSSYSTGSNYYAELMASGQGKVKSISQYGNMKKK